MYLKFALLLQLVLLYRRNFAVTFIFSGIIFALYIYVPHNEHFKEILDDVPKIKINQGYFINMDESTDRKARFLKNYNGTFKMERIPGVKVSIKKGVLGRGTYGCALAHSEAMHKVANSPEGWYLICEDDCVGDFSKLEENIILRNVVYRTSKQFINLGKYKWSTYSLSDINLCLQAYLITPRQAAKTRDRILSTIDGPKAVAVDELVVKMYRTPKYFGQEGDGSGCHVTLFDAVGPSDICKEGR